MIRILQIFQKQHTIYEPYGGSLGTQIKSQLSSELINFFFQRRKKKSTSVIFIIIFFFRIFNVQINFGQICHFQMEGLAIGRASLVFNWKNCKMVGTPAPDVAFLGLPTFFFSLKIGCRLPALVFSDAPLCRLCLCAI